jgi:hypothetical protein
MNQDKPESQLSDDICEAVDCFAKAATTILVRTGDRSVALNLCNSCTSRFEDTAAGPAKRANFSGEGGNLKKK